MLAEAERRARELPDRARRRAGARARRRGLASGGGRDRRLAAGRAPPPPGGPDRARRRGQGPRLGAQRSRLRPARGARGLRRAPRPLRRPSRRRRARDRGSTASRPSARPSPRTSAAALPESAGCGPRSSTRSSAARASATTSPSSSPAWPRSARATRASGCWSRRPASRDVRPMGEGERHARFSLRSGSRRALGVAFGVDGELDAASRAGTARRLGRARAQPVERRGRAARGARPALPACARPSPATPGAKRTTAAALAPSEFWCSPRRRARRRPRLAAAGRRSRRRNGARGRPPGGIGGRGDRRAGLQRRDRARVCADAIRRRELVERAARPARFGGGEVAIVSARLRRRGGHGGGGAGQRRGSRRRARRLGGAGARAGARRRLRARRRRRSRSLRPPRRPLPVAGAAICTGSTAAARPSSLCACTPTSGRSRASLAALYRALRAAAAQTGTIEAPRARARALRRGSQSPALARGRGAVRPACWASSTSCDGRDPAMPHRSGSYPRRGRISSDPRPSSPTATAHEEGRRFLSKQAQKPG